jgi:hypothetical protein
MKNRLLPAIVIALVGFHGISYAAVSTLSNPLVNTFPSVNMTMGYEFHVHTDLTVGALGYYDVGSDGFIASHQVGLWEAAAPGTLLGSVVIPSGTGATLGGLGYRYVSLTTPLTLTAGQNYRIGAQIFGDAFLYGATFTLDPAIGFVQDRATGGPGLNYPTDSAGRSSSRRLPGIPSPQPSRRRRRSAPDGCRESHPCW